MSTTTRTRLLALTFVFAFMALPAAAQRINCNATANMVPDPDDAGVAWQRWERKIVSEHDYLANHGNPSRTVQLTVTFTQCEGKPQRFTAPGFWHGLPDNGTDPGHDFRIRGAFPPGEWQWELTCRRRNPGGPDCGNDDILDGAKGRFVIGEGAGLLYSGGFLRVQYPPKKKPPFLAFNNLSNFFWLGDTVWNANILMTQTEWETYLQDRATETGDGANNRFTVLQMAIAPRTAVEERPAAPRPFESTGATGCPNEITEPGPCARMNPVFWKAVDDKVQAANEHGLVVMFGSIIDITGDVGHVSTSPAELRTFADNIVGRLYGNFVIFSPGFDHKLTAPGSNAGIVDSVGTGLNQATTRHLITNHTAGGSDVEDYINHLHSKTWLDFQLFQSGTPGNTETEELANLTDRAVTIPTRLGPALTVPPPSPPRRKPAINGESVYPGQDKPANNLFAANHTPYRARQTAYLSMLSGAQGFTMGTCGVLDWGLTTDFAGCTPSWDWKHADAVLTAKTMKVLRSHFQAIPWTRLMPQPGRIKNQNADPDKKMVLAYDGASVVMAYVTNELPGIRIKLGAGDGLPTVPGFAGTNWPSNWSATWLSPRTGMAVDAGRPQGSSAGLFEFLKPTFTVNPGQPHCETEDPCDAVDWLLRISKGAPPPSVPVTEGLGSPSLAKSAAEASGNRMVVWQTDTANSTTIYGQIFNAQGGTVAGPFPVASGKTASPGHPDVAALADGNFVVAWSGGDKYNYGPWIRMRRYDRDGGIVTFPAFAVACNYVAGDYPQVAAVGDGYAIAWERSDDDGIYVLQVEGTTRFEARIAEGMDAVPILETLEGSTGSAVTVTYGLYGEDGSTVGGNTVTVTPLATGACAPPLAVDDAFETEVGEPITISLEEILENDAPGITFHSVDAKCQLTASRRACIYRPPSGFPAPPNTSGIDTFSYSVRAGGVTESAVIRVTVLGTSSGGPVANPDSFTVEGDQSLTVTSTQLLANDSQGAVFAGAQNAVNGTISCTGSNPATCIFTPTPGFRGTASFQYSISANGSAPFVTGNVTVVVTEPGTGTPPQAAFVVSCGPDAQHPNDSYRTCRVSTRSTGSITRWLWNWGDGTPVIEAGSGDQSHTYAHSGRYTITHTVYDGVGRSSTWPIAIVANTPPIAVDDSGTTQRNTAVTIHVTANDRDPDGDSIELTDDPIILPPAHGSAVPVDGSKIKYTPYPGFVGADQFTYEIIDTLGEPASAVVTITVIHSGPPVARNDHATTRRDTPVTINLLENDQDPDGQAIWLTVNPIKTLPRNGTVTVLSQTSVRYTPDLRWGGNDVFEYEIADASGNKDRAWVAVHVGRTRSLPVAVDDAASTVANRGVTIDVLANDSSPDGDPITLTRHPFLSRPLHGRVTRVSDSQVSYTPQADWAGTDTFAYEISDSEYGTAAAFVTVTVTAENRPPVANPDSAATGAGVSVTIDVTANDTDPDGDPVALSPSPISVAPQHGSVTRVSASSIAYTPAPGYAGTDTFQYEISDGHGYTARGTVTVTIANTNHPPEAFDDEAATSAGVPVTIEVTANDSDVDGDQVSLIGSPVITPPTNGTAVKVNGSSITYTPRSGYTGTDRFQYEIGDHNGARARAWVDVTVGTATVNRNPVAVDDEVTMLESTTRDFDVTANDSDPDGDPVSLISSPIIVAPAHGTAVKVNNSTIRYTPTPGYVGIDTLQYEIGDGRGKRSRAWLRITVREANSRPVAVGDEASTSGGAAVTVRVTSNDYDPDGDVVQLISSPVITPPEHGTATKVDADSIRYVPQAGFGGTDRFQYEIGDGRGGRHRAWVNITVSGASAAGAVAALSTTGVPPLAGNDAAEAFTDTSVAVVVLTNDLSVDGRPVALTANPIVTPPLYGTAQRANDTTLTYTPSVAFRGNDRLEYEVVNADGVTTTAWVTIQIPGDNEPPVAVDDATSAAKDGSATIAPLGNDTDENGDALVLTVRAVVAAPQNGTVRRADDRQLLYTPAPGFTGDDSFVYEITDKRGGTAQATVVVHVIGGVQTPVALDDSATVQAGRAVAVNVVANDSDPDGDPVRVVASEPPLHGTLLWSDGTATYQPHSGYVGPDSFRYTISDPSGLQAQGTVSITVVVLNNPTTASNDSVETKTRTPVLIGVLANDYDPDPQRLTIASVTQPARGTVAISGDRLSVTYTPASDFAGAEGFQYTVTDGPGSVTASVAVTVRNQAPVPRTEILAAPEDTWVGYQSYHVLGNDVDPDGDELRIVSIEQPANGQFQVSPDNGQFSYKANANWSGMDSFYYIVSDPFGAQVRVLSQIGVSQVNDAPVANNDSFNVYKNQILTLTQAQIVANDTDVEGHQISVHSVGPATNGVARMLADGSIEYAPYGEFVGTDSFEYTVQDSGGGAYGTARVTVNVLQDTKPVANFTVTCNGLTCTFDASSSTDDRGIVSYQWLIKTGAPTATAAAGKTFSFTYPSAGVFDARLTVEDTLGQTAAVVKWVTVCAPLGISTQPASKTIPTGTSTTLTVVAGGSGPFSYQWYEGTAGTTTTPVGTNSSSYTTPALTANKSYWVRVTSTCSGSTSVNSSTATITITCAVPPSISASPTSRTITAGQTTTLSVTASGFGPLTYQWYQGTAPSTATPVGTNSSSLTVTPAATTNYWVRVSNACGGTNSTTATVTIPVNAPPISRRQLAFSLANSQTSITASWTQPTQAGTLLVAVISGLKDPAALSWTAPAGWVHAVTQEWNNVKTSIYYFPNNAGGRTAETFTVAMGYHDQTLTLMEYIGILAANPLDKTAVAGNDTNDGFVETGYTANTVQPKELVITGLTANTQTEFWNPSSGFVELFDRSMLWNLSTAVHERITTTAGPWGHYATIGAPAEWVGVVATFRGADPN